MLLIPKEELLKGLRNITKQGQKEWNNIKGKGKGCEIPSEKNTVIEMMNDS